MNKTIALIASSRRNGNTGKFIDHVATELGVEVIDIASLNISAYDYEHKSMDDDFLPTIKYILCHDNIIFASPVYWYAMSAQMKIFFDRISELLSVKELKELGREFRKKTGFILATSVHEALDHTFIEGFSKIFNYLGMNYGGHLHAICKDGFDPKKHEMEIFAFTDKLRNC